MRLEGPLQDAFESMLLSTEFRADFQVDLKVLIELKKVIFSYKFKLQEKSIEQYYYLTE